MSNIREEMPVLVRHEGDWQGTYTIVDNEGNIIDKHTSHLTCQFTENAENPYFQTNIMSGRMVKKKNINFQEYIGIKRFGLIQKGWMVMLGK